jgi:5-(carboxyamino)imidazole ribonucleotide mutase
MIELMLAEVSHESNQALVGVIMGSQSDWPTMRNACEILGVLGIPWERCVVSAHRTPERMHEYATTAKSRGLRVIIAGAGGAAHLPGMVSGLTRLPVHGVPVKSSTLSGIDSLYSIVQMPKAFRQQHSRSVMQALLMPPFRRRGCWL